MASCNTPTCSALKMMAEIAQNLINVLDEAPDQSPPLGFDLLQNDLD